MFQKHSSEIFQQNIEGFRFFSSSSWNCFNIRSLLSLWFIIVIIIVVVLFLLIIITIIIIIIIIVIINLIFTFAEKTSLSLEFVGTQMESNFPCHLAVSLVDTCHSIT